MTLQSPVACVANPLFQGKGDKQPRSQNLFWVALSSISRVEEVGFHYREPAFSTWWSTSVLELPALSLLHTYSEERFIGRSSTSLSADVESQLCPKTEFRAVAGTAEEVL